MINVAIEQRSSIEDGETWYRARLEYTDFRGQWMRTELSAVRLLLHLIEREFVSHGSKGPREEAAAAAFKAMVKVHPELAARKAP